MRGVVVIPIWNRPEFLAITLEYIQTAINADKYFYIFQLDYEFDPDCIKIIQNFKYNFSIHVRPNRIGCGNSANIMDGLARGYVKAAVHKYDTIHLIEEDIWIAKDYFEFHELAHKQFLPLVVSACKNQHLTIRPHEIPNLVYRAPQYQSIGVSFSKSFLNSILLHDCNSYYNNMENYCKINFPNSTLGGLFAEQDGLIWRMIQDMDESVIYPFTPRAYHAGYYSYHRFGGQPVGTLEEKIEQLRSMSDIDMNAKSHYKDIISCDLKSDRQVSKLIMREFP